jgi:hypothetical protein
MDANERERVRWVDEGEGSGKSEWRDGIGGNGWRLGERGFGQNFNHRWTRMNTDTGPIGDKTAKDAKKREGWGEVVSWNGDRKSTHRHGLTGMDLTKGNEGSEERVVGVGSLRRRGAEGGRLGTRDPLRRRVASSAARMGSSFRFVRFECLSGVARWSGVLGLTRPTSEAWRVLHRDWRAVLM